jgi:hypothetical protein
LVAAVLVLLVIIQVILEVRHLYLVLLRLQQFLQPVGEVVQNHFQIINQVFLEGRAEEAAEEAQVELVIPLQQAHRRVIPAEVL